MAIVSRCGDSYTEKYIYRYTERIGPRGVTCIDGSPDILSESVLVPDTLSESVLVPRTSREWRFDRRNLKEWILVLG